MTHIVSFVFGALLVLFFVEMNVAQMKSYWQHAYQVGRDDGYTLGRAEYDMTHEQMRYECERLHWEAFDGKER
jgi:hypothetical protein|tara:strand:- start:662 stop:880 length:219 start_codon:yes stop_codon:yes gene_type:complete